MNDYKERRRDGRLTIIGGVRDHNKHFQIPPPCITGCSTLIILIFVVTHAIAYEIVIKCPGGNGQGGAGSHISGPTIINIDHDDSVVVMGTRYFHS